MFERGIAASGDLRSREIICFPTKIPFLAQNLALSTKNTKLAFSLSPDCTFIRQGICTYLLCSITSWSLGMKGFFKRKYFEETSEKDLGTTDMTLKMSHGAQDACSCLPNHRELCSKKKQYHSVKWGNLFALIVDALLSTVCTSESVGTGSHVLERQKSPS